MQGFCIWNGHSDTYSPHDSQKRVHGTRGYKVEGGRACCADGTLLIYKPFRRPSRELCFLRMQLQQALLYEALPAVSGHRSAHIKAFDNIADGADAFVR